MTIYDIAKEAGVSATTVSRVINQKPGVKESTRERIQQILKKYKYLPNPAAKELADKNSKTIALITEDIRDVHYSSTVFTIEQELSKRGYNCLLINTGKDIERRVECVENAMQKQAAGVIFIGSTFQEKYIQKAITRFLPNTPIVIANGYLTLPNVCGIICNGGVGIEMAVDYLVDKGHKRIAYVGNEKNASARSKKSGYLNAISSNNLDAYIQEYNENANVDEGKACTAAILSNYDNITAIVYDQDILAVGGAQYILEMGKRVPEDISIVGFNNSIFADSFTPKITSIDDKIGVMGVKCAQALLDMLEDDAEAIQMMLIPEMIFRESTK